MRTISPPEQPWGATDSPQGQYAPTHPFGKRVLGWEDVNVTQLANDIGVSFRYLIGVLTGQRNCTLYLLQRTARALGISLTALIDRIEHAYHLRRQAVPVDKNERRRRQSEGRVLQLSRLGR